MIRSLCITSGEKLWIGTEDGVITCDLGMNDTPDQSVNQPQVFRAMRCDQIMVDRQGYLWLIIGRSLLFSGTPNLEVLGHEKGDIQALLQDSIGQVWVGTQTGLFKLSKGKLVNTRWSDENIISLFEDSFQRIWIGTFGNGVICWDPHNNQFLRLNDRDGLVNGSVLSIAGFDSEIWLATLGGIVKIDNKSSALTQKKIEFTNLTTTPGLSGEFFYKVFVGQDGTVWLGTDGGGAISYFDGKVTNLLDANLLPAKTIYSITQDNQGSIWFATGGNGVFRYYDSTYEQLTLKDGLRNQTITSIAGG